MKKILVSLFLLFSFACAGFADYESNLKSDCSPVTKSQSVKKCDECTVEDDEYCVYNQCFFDKKFRKMKQALCLSEKQELYINNLYKIYKADMEILCSKYKNQKNKVLEMIECNNQCWKEERKVLKELKQEAKERYICFRDDVKELLCKEQRKTFNKFQRKQKKKLKRLIRYGAIYKLPCTDCSCK